ncbi:MAG: hypothetical protein ACREHF_12675 [Rhizomicrobium sp.]
MSAPVEGRPYFTSSASPAGLTPAVSSVLESVNRIGHSAHALDFESYEVDSEYLHEYGDSSNVPSFTARAVNIAAVITVVSLALTLPSPICKRIW